MYNVSTKALIDSGAQRNLISQEYVQKHLSHLPLQKLTRPIKLLMADGTSYQKALYRHELEIEVQTNQKRFKQTFLVVPLHKYDVFLGTPWLKAQNPFIDWRTGRIARASPAMELAIQEKQQQDKVHTSTTNHTK